MDRLIAILISYISGSIPFSYLLGLYCGNIDLRKTGSGNVGATNLYRACGFKYGLAGFLLDFSKGFFTLYLLNMFFKLDELTIVFSGIFVVLGHIFPVVLGLKGGKGVSTTAGVLFFLDYRLFLITFTFFWIVFLYKKLVSLASVSAAGLLVILALLFYRFNLLGVERVIVMVVAGVLIILSHIGNIKRIFKKEERRINER